MSADDPSTRFMSMSRKTNKYFLSWCAVLSPCHKARGSPRHPALTASKFCGHATGVDPHREDAGPIFLVPGGRLHRSIGLRDTAHQRQPRQFAFGYAGFGRRKRIEAEAVTPSVRSPQPMTPSCSQRPARRTTGRESSLLPADSTIPSAASSDLNDVTQQAHPR
jgi:hypothetical protein